MPTDTPLSPASLHEWARLAEAATSGSWALDHDDTAITAAACDTEVRQPGWIVSPPDDLATFEKAQHQVNMRFIAAARTAVPALLDELRRLDGERDELDERLKEVVSELNERNAEVRWECDPDGERLQLQRGRAKAEASLSALKAETAKVRDTIIKLARDVGTVSSVAQRPSKLSHDDRQMIARLDEWRSTLFDCAAALASPDPTEPR